MYVLTAIVFVRDCSVFFGMSRLGTLLGMPSLHVAYTSMVSGKSNAHNDLLESWSVRCEQVEIGVDRRGVAIPCGL